MLGIVPARLAAPLAGECKGWPALGADTVGYLREHHAEPVYANDAARATGVSESRLKILFRYALNLPWVKYLQGYHIHRAAVLLSEGRLNVTEAALEVEFDRLSHFNETFHLFMGVSPKSFVRK